MISAPDSPGLPIQHVNADLPRLARFLLETCRSRQAFPELGDEQIDELIGEVERRLLALDPGAFSDPDNWWTLIYEQLRDGLL